MFMPKLNSCIVPAKYEECSKKRLQTVTFCFFSSVSGGGTSESVCATFGQVLMYTEPQKKITKGFQILLKDFSRWNFQSEISPRKNNIFYLART